MPITKLGKDNISKISEITNLRSLELQGWEKWESLKPLRTLSMLEVLSCHGSHMLSDIMLCASWSNLKAITLAEYQAHSSKSGISYERWVCSTGIGLEAILTMLAARLLELPQLASIQAEPGLHKSYTIRYIASLHADQWRQLEGQPGQLLYHRVRDWILRW